MQALRARPFSGQQAGAPARARRQQLQISCAVKQRSGQEIVCSKTLIAKQEKKAEVQRMCQDVESFSKQLLAQREAGLVEYACMADRWEDNVFHIWERFDSNASLNNYVGSERVQQFMQKVRPAQRASCPADGGGGAYAIVMHERADPARAWRLAARLATRSPPAMQVQPLLEQPIGMAMYQFEDGNIGSVCLAEGELASQATAGGAGGAQHAHLHAHLHPLRCAPPARLRCALLATPAGPFELGNSEAPCMLRWPQAPRARAGWMMRRARAALEARA